MAASSKPPEILWLCCWRAKRATNALPFCAGAGISIPAGLPNDAALARKLHERFSRVAGYHCTTPDNLVAVADAAAALPDGLAAVQHVVLDLAPSATTCPPLARPARRRDALRLLLTNWDDCVERSWREFEHIPSACNGEEETATSGARKPSFASLASRLDAVETNSASRFDAHSP